MVDLPFKVKHIGEIEYIEKQIYRLVPEPRPVPWIPNHHNLHQIHIRIHRDMVNMMKPEEFENYKNDNIKARIAEYIMNLNLYVNKEIDMSSREDIYIAKFHYEAFNKKMYPRA
jgi:hypothetical protein